MTVPAVHNARPVIRVTRGSMLRTSAGLQATGSCANSWPATIVASARCLHRMRAFLAILAAVAATFVGPFVLLSALVTPRSVLDAKYAKTASQCLTLSDGARVHYRDQG